MCGTPTVSHSSMSRDFREYRPSAEAESGRFRKITASDVLFGIAIASIVIVACATLTGIGLTIAGAILADVALAEIGIYLGTVAGTAAIKMAVIGCLYYAAS